MPMSSVEIRERDRLTHKLTGIARGHGGDLSFARVGTQSRAQAQIIYATGGRVVVFEGEGKNKLEALRDLHWKYVHGRVRP